MLGINSVNASRTTANSAGKCPANSPSNCTGTRSPFAGPHVKRSTGATATPGIFPTNPTPTPAKYGKYRSEFSPAKATVSKHSSSSVTRLAISKSPP